MNLEIHGAARGAAVDYGGAPALGTRASAPTALLPQPGTPGLDDVQNAMSMMFKLVSKQGEMSMASGEIGVDAETRQQQAQSAREAAALKQQEADEAKLDSGGLLGEIGHAFEDMGKDLLEGNIGGLAEDTISDAVNIVDNPHFGAQLEAIAPAVAEYVGIAAAIVGAAALTVCTCGAGGAVVAAVVIALSASGMVVSKTGCLGKDSAYIGLGLDVAAAVVSFGASSAMLANGAIQTASAVADGVSGATDVVAGAASVVVGHEQADVVDDTADVQQTMQQINQNARLTADLVAGLKAAQDSNKHALQVLSSATQTYNQTLTLASAAKG